MSSPTMRYQRAIQSDARYLGICLTSLAALWHVSCWLCIGKQLSYLPDIFQFLLMFGPFFLFVGSLWLTWKYVRGGRQHPLFFGFSAFVGLSPLLVYAAGYLTGIK